MSDKKRLFEKIRKLLAMAEQDSSPNEAMIAAAKARALLREHNLSREDVIFNDSTVKEKRCDTERQRLNDWICRLAGVVAESFDCDHFVNSRRESKQWNQGIVFVGVEEDSEIAGHVFNFLFRFIQNSKTKNKTQFAYGFVLGVQKKLASEAVVPSREMAAKGNSLVLAKKAIVERHMELKKYDGESSTKSTMNAGNEEFKAGYKEGLNCQITPGVKAGSPNENSQLQLDT